MSSTQRVAANKVLERPSAAESHVSMQVCRSRCVAAGASQTPTRDKPMDREENQRSVQASTTADQSVK